MNKFERALAVAAVVAAAGCGADEDGEASGNMPAVLDVADDGRRIEEGPLARVAAPAGLVSANDVSMVTARDMTAGTVRACLEVQEAGGQPLLNLIAFGAREDLPGSVSFQAEVDGDAEFVFPPLQPQEITPPADATEMRFVLGLAIRTAAGVAALRRAEVDFKNPEGAVQKEFRFVPPGSPTYDARYAARVLESCREDFVRASTPPLPSSDHCHFVVDPNGQWVDQSHEQGQRCECGAAPDYICAGFLGRSCSCKKVY